MHIQSNQTHPGHWEKLISLPKKPPTSDHIVDLVKSSITSEWYDSIFQTMRKCQHLQHPNTSFLRSLLPPTTNLLRPRISFRVKTFYIDNQYYLY